MHWRITSNIRNKITIYPLDSPQIGSPYVFLIKKRGAHAHLPVITPVCTVDIFSALNFIATCVNSKVQTLCIWTMLRHKIAENFENLIRIFTSHAYSSFMCPDPPPPSYGGGYHGVGYHNVLTFEALNNVCSIINRSSSCFTKDLHKSRSVSLCSTSEFSVTSSLRPASYNVSPSSLITMGEI